MNLENYLLSNGFSLDTYYGSNKRFVLEINDIQNLYVRIFSNTNTIINVEYESLALTSFEKNNIVSFETITTIEQLEYLLKAFI